MKVLLRHVPSTGTEYVDLAGIPQVDDEIHWPDRILRVHSVKWFPLPGGTPLVGDDSPVACLYVSNLT